MDNRNKLSEEEFILKLTMKFPLLSNILLDDDWMNSIHLQLGALRNCLEILIKQKKYHELKEILNFLEQNLMNVNKNVYNAICVSFLEHLNNGQKTFLKSSSYPKLNKALNDITDFNSKIASEKNVKDFFKDLDSE